MEPLSKTLLVLSPGFARDENDSTCIPMQQSFLLELQKTIPHLKIIVLAFQYPYHAEPYQWHGISVIPFNGRNKGGLTKLLLRRKVRKEMEKIHKQQKIDGILSFWYNECAVAGKCFSDKYRSKHYCWIWGQDAKADNKYPGRWKIPGKDLVCFSDFLQSAFEKNHGIYPAHVITPGIDDKISAWPLPAKNIDILGAGSLIKLKQFDVFIDIINEIRKDHPGTRAMIAGDGPEKSKLEEQVKKLGLQDNVVLTGEIPHEELLNQMERSRLFLHTSSYEGFGVVNIEALAAGARVISFVKPMKQEVENWFAVNTKDEMIQMTKKLMNMYSSKRVIPFSIKKTVAKFRKLFSF